MINAIFFDLDGTLVDTAPDLVFAINQVLIAEDKPALPFEQLSPFVSGGSTALINIGFGIKPSHADFARLQQRFLSIYFNNLCNHSQLYPGLKPLLDALDNNKITWGVITNKPRFLTQPLLKQLNLLDRAHIVISGDTYPLKKPDPYPLLQACKLTDVSPTQALYIGDDKRDIVAAKRANMISVCAEWGYDANQNTKEWMADHYVKESVQLITFVSRKYNLL